jgi:hypothetical protein
VVQRGACIQRNHGQRENNDADECCCAQVPGRPDQVRHGHQSRQRRNAMTDTIDDFLATALGGFKKKVVMATRLPEE